MDEQNDTCAICGNSLNNMHYTVMERMFNLNQSFDYLHCDKCGTLQLNSHINDMSYFYPKTYGGFAKSEDSTSLFGRFFHRIAGNILLNCFNQIPTKGWIDNNNYEYLRCIMNIKIRKNSSILDLGCGSGRWLEKLSDLGFKNLTGIDLFIDKGIDTNGKWRFIQGEIFDIQKQKFDVIILHHSFEHMKNPVGVLSKIRELLNENGVCIIRVPVMGKFAWRKYKTNWVQIDAPRHLFLYSTKAMNYIGKKAELKLKKIIYDSDEFQFWGSEVYANKNINLVTAWRIKASLFSQETLCEYKDKAKSLNQKHDGDQAIFYFTKS